MKLMRYAGNASGHDQTGGIAFPHDDDRPTIMLGGVGELTDQEVATLSGMGIVLESVGGKLDDLSVKDLESEAAKLGADVPEDAKKPQLVAAVAAKLAEGAHTADQFAVGGTTVGASGGPTGTSTGGGTTAGGGTAT